jgi:hypothetical protein
MIPNDLFYCPNSVTYPPFKNGLYLEEYFLIRMTEHEEPALKRTYIPCLWTNFQIEEWFSSKKQEMQQALDDWVRQNPSESGYFTVVQHDDGPSLLLPENTRIYGACSGDIPIPLIYEDSGDTLIQMPKKSFAEKQILCSFVGNITANNVQPNVREIMKNTLLSNPQFVYFDSGGWTPSVNENLQHQFINITINSKFALAPRGYGRSSFRFFECFQLGTIPIYLWNDLEWLPFRNIIDYSKLCISLHISRIGELENIMSSITEEKYNEMLNYYEEIKHLFDLEGMTQQIMKDINN